jgi:predicted ATPase
VALLERLVHQLEIPATQHDAFVAAARSQQHLNAWLRTGVESSQGSALRSGADLPFVGRESEMDLLRTRIAGLGMAPGRVVLLAGETGIGKSRLLRELYLQVARLGVPIVQTRCFEIEQGVAFHALADLVQQLCTLAQPCALASLDAIARAEIAAVVPSVRERLEPLPPLSGEIPDARRVRLLGAVASLVERVSQSARLVLMIDDIHWLDEASAQAVHHLACLGTPSASWLLVLAGRTDEIDGTAPGMRVQSALSRLHGTDLMRLERLSRADIQRLLQRLYADDAAPADCLDRACEASDGNPLFLAAVLSESKGPLQGPLKSGTDASSAARQIIRDRLVRLSAPARHLLDGAAVLGRHFEFELLRQIVPLEDEVAFDALDELLQRRWLSEDGASRDLVFVHDRLREITWSELSSARRRFLHAAAARALRGSAADRTGARRALDHAVIAEHESHAGHWPAAVEQRRLAGEQAEAVFAVREAIGHYDAALAWCEQQADRVMPADATALLECRGLAHAWLSDVDSAERDLGLVVQDARRCGDVARAVRLLTILGVACQRADRHEAGRAALDEAAALAATFADRSAWAEAIYWRGDSLWLQECNREAHACYAQVLAVCDQAQLGDAMRSKALHGLGEVAALDARPAEALALLEQSLAMARRCGDRLLECENLTVIAWVHLSAHGTGDLRAALQASSQARAVTLEADLVWQLSPIQSSACAALAEEGRYEEATAGFLRAIEMSRELGAASVELIALVWLAQCRLDAGNPAGALVECDAAEGLMVQRGVALFSHHLPAIRAQALTRLGRPGEAPDLCASYASAERRELGAAMLRILCAQIEWHAACGRLREARQAAQQLLELATAHGVAHMVARARDFLQAAPRDVQPRALIGAALST